MKLSEQTPFLPLGEIAVHYVSILPKLVALDGDGRLRDTVFNVNIFPNTPPPLVIKSDNLG